MDPPPLPPGSAEPPPPPAYSPDWVYVQSPIPATNNGGNNADALPQKNGPPVDAAAAATGLELPIYTVMPRKSYANQNVNNNFSTFQNRNPQNAQTLENTIRRRRRMRIACTTLKLTVLIILIVMALIHLGFIL